MPNSHLYPPPAPPGASPASGASPSGSGNGAGPSTVLTVGQLNRLARQLLEDCFPLVWVEGEISNLSRPSSGHWYFTLKDDQAQVRCAMFRNRNFRLRFQPANGARVLVQAKLSLYEARGDYQLIAETMQPAGAGLLAVRFEALKQQLQAEGLFAAERKRPLTTIPSHIAVITSSTGAAIRDILTVLRRRCAMTRITILPVPVQGDQAAPAIVRALHVANRLAAEQRSDFDVVLVSRGGGSLEDLWPFNEEAVARAIAASALPVISAVGHETDTTIADLVADQRAPTPSAAAELLSPDCETWYRRLDQCDQRLWRHWRQQQERRGACVADLHRRLPHPGRQLQQRALRVDELERRLQRAMRQQQAHRTGRVHDLQRRLLHPGQQLRQRALRVAELTRGLQRAVRLRTTALRNRTELLHSRLQRHHPGQRLQRLRQRLRHCEQALPRLIGQRLEADQRELKRLAQLLHSVSPLATLERGYAIVTTEDGAVVRSSVAAPVGSRVRARLAEGELMCRVEEQSTPPPNR